MTSRTLSACTVALFLTASAVAFADPKDEIIAAAQKLAGAANYHWTQTIAGGLGAAGEGKIQSDGLTYLSLTIRDNTLEIYFQGDKGAVKTDQGWQTLNAPNDTKDAGVTVMASRLAKNLKTPAALAEDLANKSTDLHNTAGTYTGTLTSQAATALLRPARRRNNPDAAGATPQVADAKGDVKFWIADGMISKIQYHITGSVSFNGATHNVDRTSTIEIKDVGKTQIDIPADAKAKWEAPASTEPVPPN